MGEDGGSEGLEAVASAGQRSSVLTPEAPGSATKVEEKVQTPATTFKGHVKPVRSIKAIRDTIFSCSDDAQIKAISRSTGQIQKIFKGHTGAVYGIELSPSTELLYSCSLDGSVREWKTKDATSVAVYGEPMGGHHCAVMSIASWTHPQTREFYLFSGGEDGTIIRWDTTTKQVDMKMTGHDGSVLCLRTTSDGVLFSGSVDTFLRKWDVETGQCLSVLRGPPAWISNMAIYEDANLLFSCSSVANSTRRSDSVLLCWNLETERVIRATCQQRREVVGFKSSQGRVKYATPKIEAQEHPAFSLAAAFDTVYVGGRGKLMTFDSQTGVRQQDIVCKPTENITCITVGGLDLVAGSSEGRVYICDLKTKMQASIDEYRGREGIGVKTDVTYCNKMIRQYGDKKDLPKALAVYTVMKDVGASLEEDTFAALIESSLSCDDTEKVGEAVAEMRSRGVIPGLSLYNALIKSHCHAGDVELAVDTMEEMKRDGLNPNTTTFNPVIAAYVKAGELMKALRTFEKMEKLWLTPDDTTICLLIQGYARAGHLDLAFKLIDVIRRKAINPSVTVQSSLMEACVLCAETDKAFELYHKMKNRGQKPNLYTYNVVMRAHSHAGNLEQTFEVMEELLNRGFSPTVWTYNYLINVSAKQGDMKLASNLMTEMKNIGIQPNASTYNTFIHGYSKSGQIRRVFTVFEKMTEEGMWPDSRNYESLIEACVENGNPKAALEFHSSMVKAKIKPTLATYKSLIKGYCGMKQIDKAYETWQTMTEEGIQPDGDVVFLLTKAALESKKLHAVFQIIGDAVKENIQLPDSIFLQIIKTLDKSGSINKLQSLLNIMDRQNISVSKTVYLELIQAYAKHGEKLQALVQLQRMATQFELDLELFVRILDASNTQDLVDKAFEIFDEHGNSQDPVVTVAIVKALLRTSRLQRAIDSYNHLKSLTDQKHALSLSNLVITTLGKSKDFKYEVPATPREPESESDSGPEVKKEPSIMTSADICLEAYKFLRKHKTGVDLLATETVISTLVSDGRYTEATSVFEDMRSRHESPSLEVINAIVLGYGFQGKFEISQEWILEMKRERIWPTATTFSNLVKVAVACHHPSIALTTLRKMLAYSMPPDVDLFVRTMEEFIEQNLPLQAFHAMVSLSKSSIRIDGNVFRACFHALVKDKTLDPARDCLVQMEKAGFEVVDADISLLVKAYANDILIDRALAVLERYSKGRMVVLEQDAYEAMIEGNFAKKSYQSCLDWYDQFRTKSFKPSREVLQCALLSAVQLNKVGLIDELLDTQEQYKYAFPEKVYLSAIDAIIHAESFEKGLKHMKAFDAFGPKPISLHIRERRVECLCRLGNVEEPKAIAIEMRKELSDPTIKFDMSPVYANLIYAFIVSGDEHGAYATFKRKDIPKTTAMFISLIEAYTKIEKLGRIRGVLKVCEYEGIEPNKKMYEAAIKSCLELDGYEEARKVARDMDGHGLEVPQRFSHLMRDVRMKKSLQKSAKTVEHVLRMRRLSFTGEPQAYEVIKDQSRSRRKASLASQASLSVMDEVNKRLPPVNSPKRSPMARRGTLSQRPLSAV